MNSYNKQALDIIAKEQGFIRDNLEKVMRLVEILNYFHHSLLLSKSLVLKGGTAINLTIFQLPRLSVDIDLDFTIDCDRESMLSIRKEVNGEILRYMESEGYRLAPGSKNPHTLDSWVFHYTNVAGNNDGIKIEINYSDRCHILPAIDAHVSISFLNDVKVCSLSPIELFATKINALIGRCAARDIYDVYNMVEHQLFVSEVEQTMLRKATVFYLTVGSSKKNNNTPTEFVDFPQIDKIRFPQIRSQLLPVLRRSEYFDFEKAKVEVKDFLKSLLVLTDSEKEYVQNFNNRSYLPELLFEDISNSVKEQANKSMKMSSDEAKRFEKEVSNIWQNADLSEEQRRIALSILSSKFNKSAFINIVEEPEQNLFPSSQWELTQSLWIFNNSLEANKLIITTHSPYLINGLTIAVKAGMLKKEAGSNEAAQKRINAIYPLESSIHPDDMAIYELDEESGDVSLLDTYHGLPSDDNFLNSMLERTNDIFADLLEIQQTL